MRAKVHDAEGGQTCTTCANQARYRCSRCSSGEHTVYYCITCAQDEQQHKRSREHKGCLAPCGVAHACEKHKSDLVYACTHAGCEGALCCAECFENDEPHAGHTRVLLKREAAVQLTSLRDEAKTCATALAVAQQHLTRLDAADEALPATESSVLAHINSTLDTLVAEVEAARGRLTAQAKAAVTQRHDKAAAERDKLQAHITQLQELCRAAKELQQPDTHPPFHVVGEGRRLCAAMHNAKEPVPTVHEWLSVSTPTDADLLPGVGQSIALLSIAAGDCGGGTVSGCHAHYTPCTNPECDQQTCEACVCNGSHCLACRPQPPPTAPPQPDTAHCSTRPAPVDPPPQHAPHSRHPPHRLTRRTATKRWLASSEAVNWAAALLPLVVWALMQDDATPFWLAVMHLSVFLFLACRACWKSGVFVCARRAQHTCTWLFSTLYWLTSSAVVGTIIVLGWVWWLAIGWWY